MIVTRKRSLEIWCVEIDIYAVRKILFNWNIKNLSIGEKILLKSAMYGRLVYFLSFFKNP